MFFTASTRATIGRVTMKTLTLALLTILSAASAFTQTPAYNLILKNDALVDSTHYEFEIWMERTGGTIFELASLQPTMTFNTGISAGTITLSMNAGTSQLNAAQEPVAMSVSGNELRIDPRVSPGAGSGTDIPVSPGIRVGRFMITSTSAFAAQQAGITWKNNTNPVTKVFAYDVSDINVDVTDSTRHLNSLANRSLSPPVITSTSPRPAATAGVLYHDTLRAQGGIPALTWSVIGGALPTGITLSAAGIVSGTATLAGAYGFTARVADNTLAADTAAFSLTLNAGAAAALAFVQQPTDEVAGVFIAPAPTVRLTDNLGNTVTTAGVAITMSLTSGNGSLGGSLTEITNASGVATFDSLRIDRKGTKVITASSGVTSSTAGNSFDILIANASQIRVETAADGSGSIVPAQSLSPFAPLTVYAISRDAFDNFVENINASGWTVQGATGGVAAGDLVAAGDSRSAVFTGHLIGTTQVRATAPSLTPVNSGTITVVAGSAQKLGFVQQPSNGIAGAAISPPVTVQVRDTAGNAVADENVSISMTLSSGVGTLGGTMTQLTNASGLATFGNLTVNEAGLKALTANSAGLTSAVSSGFTLSTYIITASAGPNGTITPTGAVPVNSGANQAFTVAAGPLHNIADVLVDGVSVGPVTIHTFTNVTSNHTIAASFVADTVQATVQSSPAGRTIIVDGVTLTAPQIFNWVSGSTHTIATDSVQSGAAGTRHIYQSWSDAGARAHTVSPTSNTTYTAAFVTQYFLTMTAGTGGTVSPASDWKDAGSAVPISTTANTGYSFAGWSGSGSGSYTGPLNTQSVTMDGPITQAGAFSTNAISVTVTTSPAGRQMIVDGVTYTSPRLFSWTATQSHTISVDSIVAGTSDTRHPFTSWSDAGARTHTVTPLTDSAFTANLSTQYLLTMNTGTGGTISPATDWMNSGAVVQIRATQSTGYTFSAWTGTGTGSFTGATNPVNVTVNGPITQTASFTPNPIAVTVTTSPVGRSIIVDDTVYTSPHVFNWLAAQTHTISVDSLQTGAAGTRYLYDSWGDAGARTHTITPLIGGTVTASFTTQHFLTMVGNSGGNVTPSSNWFDAGTPVLITGTPSAGYIFSSWTGAGSGSYTGTLNPQTISLAGPVTETANFVQPTVSVTIQTNPPGRTFYVDGGVLRTNTHTFSFGPGTTHTVTADSLQGVTSTGRFAWTSWSDGGARTHTLVYPGKDTTFFVNFKTQFNLTMNATPGGTVLPASGFFDSAQVVGISATPTPGFSFTGWTGSGTGSYSGPNNPGSVTMHSAISQTAGFSLSPINVVVQSNPAGRTFTVDGVPYTGSQAFVWSATDPHTLATAATQGDTATRFNFANWSDGGGLSHGVAPLGDTAFTVNYSTQYFLTMDTGNGNGTVSPASNWFNAGQAVVVSATADPGYNFGGWTGTGAGSYSGPNNPATVTMNAPVRETPNWTAGNVSVTVATNPVGLAITVDGVNYSSPRVFNWTTGSAHTIATDSIQASGLGGLRYAWATWNDAGARSHVVAPVTGTTYTATFGNQYLLTMVANPGGTVTPPTGWYDAGSLVPITGIPNTGYSFSNWSGTGSGSYSGTTNPRTITLTGAVTQTANFSQSAVQVTILTNPPGRTFRVDGSALITNIYTFTFNPAETHTLTTDSIQGTTLASRFAWTSWSDGGPRTHTITYPGKDTTIVVNFRKQFYLSMNPGTGGTVLPASGYFDTAQVVGISATPAGGYSFSGWLGSGPGSFTGPGNPGSVTMDSAITETGTFTLSPVNVTVRTNPPGLQFLVDGTPYAGSQAFVWSATTPHTISATSPQGDTATRFVYASWSDGGTQAHSVAPLSDTAFTVNFATQYFLTMDSGSGGGALSPANGFFPAGQSVQISATPAAGYNFGGWTGTGTGSYSGTNNPATLSMNAPIRETAAWTAGSIPVTVTTSPAGRAITVDGVSYTSPQTFNWTTGSAHSITSDSIQAAGTTGTRYRWTSWNDAGTLAHIVAPTSATTFTATFVTQYLLTMTANPGGTATPPTGWYDAASPVSITGIPNAGFSFSSWTGSGTGSFSGTTNPRIITTNGPITEIANFVQNPFQVVVQTTPAGRTFKVGPTNYTTLQTFSISPGTSMSLSIPVNPQSGPAGSQYLWANWSDSGAISHSFTPTSDTVITAAFTTQYFVTMSAGTGGTVAPPSGWFDSASTVQITATSGGGYTFAGWVGAGSGSYSGVANPATITVNAPVTETAAFTLFPITVRLRSNPAGRIVLVDSIAYVTPQDLIWTSGTAHSISTDSVQGADSVTRYLWTGWSDGKSRTHTVTGLSDTTFTVSFRPQYFLTMTAGTGGGVAPGSAWHDSAAIVPITATATTGHGFAGWTGAGTGSYTGALNPSTVTMLSPISQSAAFTVNTISVTVRTNPDGYPVTVDDTVYASPKTFQWSAGSIHSISTDSAQPPSGGVRLAWSSWNDAGARAHTVAPLTDSTFTATLGTQFYLTMNTNPGGTVAPPSGWFNSGQTFEIRATPNSGYTFASWSGSGTGSFSGLINPRNITMGGPISQTANFNQNTVLVTVQTYPPGRTFRVDGTSYTTVNTFSLLPGTSHTFAADSIQPGVNGRRYVWTAWSDSGARSHNFVAPGRDSTVVVSFGRQWELLTFANPAAGGTIQPPGQTYYDEGDTATVLAVSKPGYAFTSWSGGVTDTLNPVAVIMDTARSLVANFSPAATVRILTNPPGRTIFVDGFAMVAPDSFSWLLNSTHSIGTIPSQDGDVATRYLFTGWSDAGELSHSVTVSRDTAFTADFQTQYLLSISSAGNGTVQPGGGWLNAGSTVEISATPDTGYGFIEWDGNDSPAGYSGFSNPVTLTMSGYAIQVASFGVILPPPSLSGIPNHAVDQPITPRLSWNPYPGATSYIVQAAGDSVFSLPKSIVDSSGITDTTILLPVLRNVKQYFWRVKARVGSNITSFSETRDFTTVGATIAVTSPALNWGTGFTYDISWASQNLSGNVNVLLSTNGGQDFVLIDSNRSGTSTRHKVALTQTPSNFCLVRVISTANGQFYGDSRTFAILPGALPLIVPVSTTIPFPAEPTISTFYRLVSSPGVVDTTIRLNAQIPGANPGDWRLFADNGRPENYLVEMGPSSAFETGRGYWLLKRNDLSISSNMVMPPLDTLNGVYRIRLRSGWNIVANPFDRDASWGSILALNGLPSTTPLYGYEGSYQNAPLLAPFRGYYFFNTTNLTELKMAYPFGTAISSAAAREVDWELRLEYSSETNDDPTNFIGVAASAREGLDDLESHKPPIFLDQGFLYFNRPEWDREYHMFNTDYRPSVGEGQTWEFEVSRKYGTTGTIRFDGVDAVPPEYEVYLVNGYNSVPVNLRARPEYSFTSVSTTMPFRVLVGPKGYVERQVAADIPKEFGLSQNFPNPFNSTTSISVDLPRDSRIRLDVYSVLGQKVATIADGDYAGGVHTFLWEGTDDRGMPVSSGVYLYRLSGGDMPVQAKKMIIAK
jgi:uncharacterized repeat protein (TIGR02543 family)